MQIDKTTLTDLSIFHIEEEQSVFHHLNFTTTVAGKEWLRYLFSHPHQEKETIISSQQSIQIIQKNLQEWPTNISNGTIMVIEKFFETPLEPIPPHPDYFSSLSYRYFHAADFSLLKYSVNHFADFVIGLEQIISLLSRQKLPSILSDLSTRLNNILNKSSIQQLILQKKQDTISNGHYLHFGRQLQQELKTEAFELIDIYGHLDAIRSMAIACGQYHFCFPQIENSSVPYIHASGLYHPLLKMPVAYNVVLNQQSNFLFLTGANMAGKSTFIKAIGVSVYLAHIGMGVPAVNMEMSLLDGLLSNIQVEDNLTRGESYFYNEVLRIKKTIEKINDGRLWLILIDELFKGTNVQDAMKCSTAVIEGLLKMKNTMFILSTHLYEIAASLQKHPTLSFYYFETHMEEDQLVFSYQLKPGISNDRLGYLILKREGVVDLLNRL